MSNAPSGQLAMLILALSLTLHLATTGAAMSPSVSPAFAPASPHLALHHAGRRLSLTPRDAMPLRTAAPTAAPLVPGARLQLQCALGRDGQARSPSRTCSGAQSGGRGVGMGLDVRWGRPWGLAPLRSKPVGEERDAELEKSGSEEALSELVKLKHEANAGDAEAASALSKSSEVASLKPYPNP
ncbi:hypothetical protein T484DRAFT_1799941 [Baffinella frigidus]|nr:hypothetical protein T484DRAFT_1799941 [Cryptophyta sp. CCMP2293]